MKKLNLLIVEDDAEVISGYESSIKAFNKTNSKIEIIFTIESDKDNALGILRDTEKVFDGAIVDLDLKNSGGKDSSGNEIIREVKNNLRFPVFVISGTAHNIDEELSEESSFFKIKNRDDDFDFIEEMTSIYNTGITEIINRKGTIESYITKIFWDHLSNSLSLWSDDDNRSPSEKQKSLLRYTLLHLQEYLDINSSGDLEKYHPAEFLITKPVKPNYFTGDILVNKNGKRSIILTPACDIDLKSGKRKAEKILTLNIVNLSDIDAEYVNKDMSKGKREKLIKIIKNSNQRYHCIPNTKEFEIGVIDFQDKLSIDSELLEISISADEVERVATVSQPFLKDIISRYSMYYSRQGSPDFNSEEIFHSIFDK